MIDNLLKKIVNLNLKQKIILFIIGLVILILLFLLLYKIFYSNNDEIYIQNELSENATDEQKEEIKIGIKENKKTITVHVIGEVNSPGVVTLEEGSRIIDAINAAGGKTEEADLSKINLAYVIEDGIQIYIPSITETSKLSEESEIKFIREDAGEGIIISTATQENEEKNVKVNINNANLEKLQTLPGIGESTAQKIIDYREENGKFKNIEDLKNVSGIGENKYNIIKDLIIV